MKFNIIVIDPPWQFGDKLKMSDVKRSAEAQYDVLSFKDIKALKIKEIAAENALIALWCPSSMLQDGLDLIKEYGFVFKQTFIWVKIKKESVNINDCLAFNMGRLYRNCHEICLIGIKGKIYDKLKNKSQRTVCFDQNLRHSQKTEKLQNTLDIMFSDDMKRIEIFARRERKNWITIGNECPSSLNENIKISLDKIINDC